MAVHAVRLTTPATQLHGGISGYLSPSNRKLNTFVRYGCRSSNRYRIGTVLASFREDDANGRDKSVRAMEVKKILEDSPLLPKPLSSNQLAESVSSNGSRVRVAYQGVRGAYSESAAEKAYPNCEAVPCEEFDTAFEAVERWLVDRAVLPIENSLGGSIHRNYDLLLRHNLHIVGEVKLAVRHCLLANHGVNIEELRRVLSHPQALAQCENTLTKLGLVREAVDDTAGAAKQIAFEKLNDAAAVASAEAAKIYGLNIVAEDIQDDCDNVTRFLMLAREPIIPGTNRLFKTSIVFSLEEGPGVLFKALAVFALRQINLTKIESRPLRKHPLRASGGLKYFDYLFYVDFEASMADEVAQNALRHLEEFATFLRVLGSYPVDTTML
ncbi:PREDICTED: arogenate dehydratase/prephenate dehydratase 2, chloroplastic [Camelina sativa]|uniref:Arogenate dehydratase n=1 Tax=Camelina sativa TaxID=90675 RepID=A0ABM0VH14_CAMSA|nr:PREDICTED: arogenate dehydratase/prephenate dehydratase 2, chloroplastic [Camelina sativa]XP_010456088.1 PREDICTED: arogenate dehydratase/prephenate dehydratase 2, chloroplastic [Camelina sativa]